jgi:hypothetical protein
LARLALRSPYVVAAQRSRRKLSIALHFPAMTKAHEETQVKAPVAS